MKTYTTVLGDTFDKIALETLGDEYLFPLLLKENPQHRNTVIFSAGVILRIPNISELSVQENVPDWLDESQETDDDLSSGNIVALDGVDS